jgi:hypothetical protein
VRFEFRRYALGFFTAALLTSACAHTNLPAKIRREARAGDRPVCREDEIIAALDRIPQPELSWIDRKIGAVTTPFKYAGISGWEDTGCSGRVVGTVVRDAAHSSGGLFTIDVRLASAQIGDAKGPPGRYLRVEVEPGTRAHRVVRKNPVRRGTVISVAGPVVFDQDGPFLEIHPDGDFAIVSAGGASRGSAPAPAVR